MITSLRQERGVQRTVIHNAGIASNRSAGGTGAHTPNPAFPFPSGSRSVSGAATPDSATSDNDSTDAAVRARLHRDKLLTYQSQNTQRTRIHDEAADFDFGTANAKGMQWMTPLQRAAALKKQQKYMKELEEQAKPEWEREKRVLSLSVRDGKLVKSYKKEKTATAVVGDSVAEAGHIDGDGEGDGVGGHALDAENGNAPSKKAAFSNNPLLASGGLIRPIWKPQDIIDGGSRDIASTRQPDESTSTRSRQSIWRRVQDDNDDNEAWILDGGVHGYGTGTRKMEMEDGSRLECG
jgi:hypothetical protein